MGSPANVTLLLGSNRCQGSSLSGLACAIVGFNKLDPSCWLLHRVVVHSHNYSLPVDVIPKCFNNSLQLSLDSAIPLLAPLADLAYVGHNLFLAFLHLRQNIFAYILSVPVASDSDTMGQKRPGKTVPRTDGDAIMVFM